MRIFMVVQTIQEIAQKVGGELIGDGSLEISGVADIREAKRGEISFVANAKYFKFLSSTQASALIVESSVSTDRKDLALIRVKSPNQVFSKVVELFAVAPIRLEPGVSPLAQVSPEAKLGKNIFIGPFAVISENAELGEGTQVYPGVYVGPQVRVGKNCILYPNVVLRERITLGDRVRVQAGTVIGSDGFGYAPVDGKWVFVPQCGTVIVEDDVDFGANCTVDRGRFGATRIGRGCKFDNLVHVAHNVVIGSDSLIIAQVGISGSTTIGRNVILAGQVGVIGHLDIGDGARVAGQGGVVEDLPPNAQVWGSPAMPFSDYVKAQARVKKLGEFVKTLRELSKKVEALEKDKVKKGEA